MVTSTQVAAGVGGGSVGVVASEALIHVTDDQADLIVGTLGAGSLGLAAAGFMGIGPVPEAAAPGLAGFGVGSLGWLVGRNANVFPALTVNVPAEVNLAGPIITALALGTVLAAANTVLDLTGR